MAVQDNGPFAYEVRRDPLDERPTAPREIWTVNPDGTERRLVASMGGLDDAVWSPDGQWLAVGRFSADANSTTLSIVNAKTCEEREVAERAGYIKKLSWSPDSQRLAYFAREGDHAPRHLHVIESEGRELAGPLAENSANFAPDLSWSPDGSVIAYDRGPDVIATASDGGGGRVLISDASSPTWSPDGNRIAFTRRAGQTVCHVWLMEVDGSHQTQLTTENARYSVNSWSPDGTALLIDRSTLLLRGGMRFRHYLLDQTGAYRLRSPEFAAWSPDATMLYGTARRGDYIAVARTDGHERKLAECLEDAGSVRWLPVQFRSS